MKLLILGESDSHGYRLEDTSRGWGHLLPVELERRLGLDVESNHLAYYAHTASSLAYLERVLAKGPFDVIVFSVTSIGFTLLSVDQRIARLFGPRVGGWFKARIDMFDQSQTSQADRGLLYRANRGAHRAARKVIGQEAMATYEVVLENHKQIFARLARLEDSEIIVLGPTNHGGGLARRVRKTQSNVDSFRSILHAESDRRRFTWIDRQTLSEMFADRDAAFLDGLHKGPEFHANIVDAVVQVLAKSVPELAAPGTAR